MEHKTKDSLMKAIIKYQEKNKLKILQQKKDKYYNKQRAMFVDRLNNNLKVQYNIIDKYNIKYDEENNKYY